MAESRGKVRSPVYRNLDTPFEIYGFSPSELIALSLSFVAGGELAQALGVSRMWVIFAVVLLAIAMNRFRRALGIYFARRLFRFIRLPSILSAKLFRLGGDS